MTKTLTTDDNNDIFIGLDGKLAISNGIQAVLQACATAAKAQLGEMVLSIDTGVPNFQTIWQDSANVPQFEAAVRATLAAVDGVLLVEEFSATVQNNVVSYTATIKTIYGSEVLNG